MENLARRAAAPVFALALFSSAALIFMLQPLFGRMVTPLLGGSPAVWNASMAFFQAALLVGYVYAHLLAKLRDLRLQAAIHALVLFLAFLVLPLQVSNAFGEPNSDHPALWLIGVLTLSVGAPFAAASATAPLLQAWYARTGRADASDPYYLYAASNVGSFIGLLAYPILIEPAFGLHAQGLAWSSGYLITAALIVVAAVAALLCKGDAPKPAFAQVEAPSWRQRLYWMAAAAVPSALILGVTLHISTDVASAPMLWVAPLALYLATFVIAFARGSERLTPFVLLAHPVALAVLMLSYFAANNWLGALAGNLIGFFMSALLCHLALARTRPHVSRLTEFYFWVSLGGVLGGAFAAFLAPVIFNNVYEYPLALAAAALFRPRGTPSMPRLANAVLGGAAMMVVLALLLMVNLTPPQAVLIVGAIGAAMALVAAGWGEDGRAPALRLAFMGAAFTLAALVVYISLNMETLFVAAGGADNAPKELAGPWGPLLMGVSFLVLIFCVQGTLLPASDLVGDLTTGAALPSAVMLILLAMMGGGLNAHTAIGFGIVFCALALLFNLARPIMLAGLTLAAFTVIFFDDGRGGHIIHQERSFFGVLRTVEFNNAQSKIPAVRVLMHGTTIHGAQLTTPGLTRLPLTYYHPDTALGEAILAGLTGGDTSSLALIGLGAGSTACLMRQTDHLDIYEIDPAVVRLSAENSGDFTYVPECQPQAEVHLGDARLQIANAPDGAYDVIVVDAFTSDAIPAHLLTREALGLYLSKTSDRGIVVLHLSNRNLALVSEAQRVAASLNAPSLYRISNRIEVANAPFYGGLPASVMIVARSPDVLARLPLMPGHWSVLETPPGRPWSDDYINLPRALWESMSGREDLRTFPPPPVPEPAPGAPD